MKIPVRKEPWQGVERGGKGMILGQLGGLEEFWGWILDLVG